MADPAKALREILDGAVRRDERALLQLARRVTTLLERFGAYTIRKDWSRPAYDITLAVADGWQQAPRRTAPDVHLESTVKNRFWGCVLDLMTQNDVRAGELFFPTVRRLLAKWDGSRRYEAWWDDVAQDTAQQLWEQWLGGEVERPWALLCTIAKRRYLDRVRATKPTDDLDGLGDESDADADGGGGGELFTQEALAVLEPDEREIVVRMDLDGQTRVEIAADLDMTEGQVLSLRRAGLRRIWRWLGADLPPRMRSVWEEMFKGARRAGPEDVARKLGMPIDEVVALLQEAREWTGVG